MNFINFFWAVFGAVCGVSLGKMLEMWETGKKRIIYSEHAEYIVLKNISKRTLFENNDISANDPLKINLPADSIQRIKEYLTKGNEKNNQGFNMTDDGVLHFQYWENAIEVTIQYKNNKDIPNERKPQGDIQNQPAIVSGTLIEGEIIRSKIVQREYYRNYNVARTIIMIVFFGIVFTAASNIEVGTIGLVACPCLIIFSVWVTQLYRVLLKTVKI